MKNLHFILTTLSLAVALFTTTLFCVEVNVNKNNEKVIASMKKNAAYVVSVLAVSNYFSDDELCSLVKDIPKGNPFSEDFLVTAPFGKSIGYEGSYRKNHRGVDIVPVNGNWKIYPIAEGIVEDFGQDEMYGKFVCVRHSENIRSFYAHADKIFYRATTGRKVDKNTVMMIMGDTGRADGPHLHFSIQIKTEHGWVDIDSRPFLKGV